ncbi:hypothetical protein STTU_0078 [Streptomyces sp. Tu6071]|nr:hypothetical protein STTU_0078 [Streptomyces sp. Tu6071]
MLLPRLKGRQGGSDKIILNGRQDRAPPDAVEARRNHGLTLLRAST